MTITYTTSPTDTVTPTPLPPDDFWISRNVYRPEYDAPPIYARIRLSKEGIYSLKVYNSAGELVRVLRDERAQSGTYENVYWDGKNKFNESCASGVYILYYTTRYQTRLARILLLR
jgi:hypothetical protein